MNAAKNLFADGEAYERTMGRWSRLVGDEFLDWLDLSKGLRWLDVGCGNGAFTARILGRCAPVEVVAIDPSEEQLAYANAQPETKSAQFQVADAQNLPFSDGSFDAAVMALVITFVPDPARAVAEITRVVRPGGWVATYMWDIPNGGLPIAPIRMAMNALGIAPAPLPGATVSQRDVLLALWEKAGLVSVELRVIRILTKYANFDDFWISNTVGVGPLGKAIQDLSPDMRARLQSRLREILTIGPDGRVTYEAFANAVKGRVPQRF